MQFRLRLWGRGRVFFAFEIGFNLNFVVALLLLPAPTCHPILRFYRLLLASFTGCSLSLCLTQPILICLSNAGLITAHIHNRVSWVWDDFLVVGFVGIFSFLKRTILILKNSRPKLCHAHILWNIACSWHLHDITRTSILAIFIDL